MSAIGFTPDLTSHVMTRTRLRLTKRGRRLLAAIAAVPAVVALSVAVIGGSSAALASLEHGAAPATFQTVTVAPGDSLWSIAQEVAPGADPRDVVDALIRLNALEGVTVSAGERLSIPAEYAPGR
ncbi:LysM peptidoglycan-binding domain-containing protein [Microbacterium sp. SS28]|uniref:LysM peptidoglycan-binding domain-containing protein n=1 Tax=Microbacterium sp. SS28 TaxID=2919948 RepID=UPI001FAA9BB6|nr:LysM peptidoglycan-binding domain-containing protein [Microbacterium sp. SS28]